jgi:predicted DNA-binding ribbon-helix-helix protein
VIRLSNHSLNKKRSFTVGNRKTSLGLEDAFWSSLKEIAGEERLPVSRLFARIDASRQHANLSSAIRIYILEHYRRLVEVGLNAHGRGGGNSYDRRR